MKGFLSFTVSTLGLDGVFILYPMPGPAGWLVMIGVAGLLGAALRRQRAPRLAQDRRPA